MPGREKKVARFFEWRRGGVTHNELVGKQRGKEEVYMRESGIKIRAGGDNADVEVREKRNEKTEYFLRGL